MSSLSCRFWVCSEGVPALNPSWWTNIGGTPHLHWVFGWWEWMVIILFMFPNVWRMKPFD